MHAPLFEMCKKRLSRPPARAAAASLSVGPHLVVHIHTCMHTYTQPSTHTHTHTRCAVLSVVDKNKTMLVSFIPSPLCRQRTFFAQKVAATTTQQHTNKTTDPPAAGFPDQTDIDLIFVHQVYFFGANKQEQPRRGIGKNKPSGSLSLLPRVTFRVHT